MTDQYVPGALTALLSTSCTPSTEKKKKKRKRTSSNEKVPSSSASLFDKDSANTKVPELPVGESVLVPKRAKTSNENNSDGAQQTEKKDSDHLSRKKQRENRLKKVHKMDLEEKKRTVFVGNAPVSTTRKEIKKLFEKFGPVDTVRLRSIVAGDQRDSKKVAAIRQEFSGKMDSVHFYVKFKNESSVEDALKLDGEEMGEHKLRVDQCVGKKDYSPKTTVFVGNAPLDVKEDDLAKHFEKAGEVSFVRVVRDSKTGTGKGFAFVSFKDSATVPIALKMDGSKFKKRELRVKTIEKKKRRLVRSSGNAKPPRNDRTTMGTKNRVKKIMTSRRTVFESDNENEKKGLKKEVRKKIKKRQNKKQKKSLMS